MGYSSLFLIDVSDLFVIADHKFVSMLFLFVISCFIDISHPSRN